MGSGVHIPIDDLSSQESTAVFSASLVVNTGRGGGGGDNAEVRRVRIVSAMIHMHAFR